MIFPGATRALPRVQAELALARALTPDEFAAVKALRRPIQLRAYVAALEKLEAFYLASLSGPGGPEARPVKQERAPKTELDLPELYKDVQKGLKEGRKLAEICREAGILPQIIYNYRSQIKREAQLARSTKAHAPRTAPAIVRPTKRKALASGSITPAMKEEIRKRFADGEGPTKIAATMGLKVGTVSPIIYKNKKGKEEAAA